jgi:hypothetical protein
VSKVLDNNPSGGYTTYIAIEKQPNGGHKAMAKATKEVQIIARYTNKRTGTVSYLVRSSDGKSEYCTTIIDGRASGCSCPAKSSCYHKKQLVALEAARAESPDEKQAREWNAYRSELAKKLAQQFVTTQVVEQLAERQNVAMDLPAELKGYRKSAKVGKPGSADLAYKGNLNGQSGFSILRKVG